MKFVFATNNKNKLKEINALVSNIEILSMDDIGCHEDIPETELTLEGNAQLKSDYIYNKYGYQCFADDTGLEVESLHGRPGVFSARYSGEQATSASNINKLLIDLGSEENRKAQFRTVISLNIEGKTTLFEGICKGEILKSKQGNQGFGYDPIFRPDGFSNSFAEMSLYEKGKISHRGIAIQKLIQYLNKLKSKKD